MTLGQALRQFDALTQTEFDKKELVMWIAELDGMAKAEIFDQFDASPVPRDWKPYDETACPDTQLLIPAPYDQVYLDMLRMKCDNWNKEPVNYNNSYVSYNNLYGAFGDYWRRTHRAKQPVLRI